MVKEVPVVNANIETKKIVSEDLEWLDEQMAGNDFQAKMRILRVRLLEIFTNF